MIRMRAALALLSLTVLGACGERPQTTNVSAKKSDTRAYEGTQNAFVAPGWKVGDSGSWEEQLQVRVRNQNEYNRTK